MSWYITNLPNYIANNDTSYSVHGIEIQNNFPEIQVFIDGYIIPRQFCFEEYKSFDQYDLIHELYLKHKQGFIKYIKGTFNIILFIDQVFYIFSDTHGIKKFFIYRTDAGFFISGDLITIADHFRLTVNKENAALFCLFSHFMNGTTLFNNVSYSKPASEIKFENKSLKEDFYWNPIELFKKRKKSKALFKQHAHGWKTLISNYISYLRPQNISLTLTGGNDSRMVLAALVSLNKKFHAFSFGDPDSYDCMIAGTIAKHLGIAYKNYFVPEPTKDWFGFHASDIMNYGNSLVNIHRAHRNDAVVKEKSGLPDSDMIITGLMGGEYIKEPRYDNIVLPILFRDLEKSSGNLTDKRILTDELADKGIKTEEIDLQTMLETVKSFLALAKTGNKKQKKFIYTYYFYGCTHHSQDSQVFSRHIKHVVNPFMDIDFLEMISESGFWYINRKSDPFNGLFSSYYQIMITDQLARELSGIPYAKKGEYTANDLLRNKAVYMYKRVSYLFDNNIKKYPQNFPMGPWLFEYCSEKLNSMRSEIKNLFIEDFLQVQLEELKSKTNEESWQIITNPINLDLILAQYEKN